MYVFVFNDTATTEIYTLSLHDALPISVVVDSRSLRSAPSAWARGFDGGKLVKGIKLLVVCDKHGSLLDLELHPDRKSTRLNSSHANISYAVFCLKKKQHINTLRISTAY